MKRTIATLALAMTVLTPAAAQASVVDGVRDAAIDCMNRQVDPGTGKTYGNAVTYAMCVAENARV